MDTENNFIEQQQILRLEKEIQESINEIIKINKEIESLDKNKEIFLEKLTESYKALYAIDGKCLHPDACIERSGAGYLYCPICRSILGPDGDTKNILKTGIK